MVLARSSVIICLALIALTSCSDNETNLVVGENVKEIEKKILLALFVESDQKIDMEACESHTFSLVGEFLAELYSTEGKLREVSLQCPKEEYGNLFCEFNIDHGLDNTLVRFVYNRKDSRLLQSFRPRCIRVP